MENSQSGMSVAAFIGVRQGVGTTTIAAEVAAALAERAQGKILFVDLHPQPHAATRAVGLPEGRSLIDLVPEWLETGKVNPEELKRTVVPVLAGVDRLVAAEQRSVWEAERLHSYRAREFAVAVLNAAQASGYGLLAVDAGTFPIGVLPEVIIRRAEWLFLVGGKPQEDAWNVLGMWSRLPTYLRAGRQFAILRGNNAFLNPWRDKLAEAKLRPLFVPWVDGTQRNGARSQDPAFKKAIVTIVNEFSAQHGLRDRLPFFHN